MKYQSTRNNKISVDSALAIKRGISPEGGLYVPETIPAVSLDDIKGAIINQFQAIDLLYLIGVKIK